ncbi:MAG: hypothetical protein R3E95_22345 [Thiolinea sp.]
MLNYILAKLIVVSAPGTAAYNQELGKLTLMSYPVIVIPSMLVMMFAFWYLYRGIKKLTGLRRSQFSRPVRMSCRSGLTVAGSWAGKLQNKGNLIPLIKFILGISGV